jgi:phage terminase small subunit
MRPRQPTNVLLLKGSFKNSIKKPAKRANEPINTELLSKEPPEWLNEKEQECWREIVSICHPAVLGVADKVTVELVACLTAEFREAPRKMPVARIIRLQMGLSSLGMTPADRSRVSALKSTNNESPFAKFGS